MLAVSAAGDRHVGAALGEIGHRQEGIADQAEQDPMRLAQYQQIAGLGDVLGRRTPMHPAAIWLAGDAGEFPDQRHDGVAGAGKALVDAGTVEQFEPGRARDRLRRPLGDDAEVLLRLSQRRLDLEPGLPAALLAIERADAGIGHPCRRRQFVGHGDCSELSRR